MKGQQCLCIALGALAIASRLNAAPIVTFSLFPPDGRLAGQAGTSVGWGFTIDTSSDFVSIQSIAFGDNTPIGIFSTPGLPSTAATPGSPIVVAFLAGVSGLQYDISPTALLGTSTQGVMTLTYDASDADGNQIVFGDSVNAQLNGADVMAEVDVNAEAGGSVPEPGPAVLIGIGCAALAWGARRRRVSP